METSEAQPKMSSLHHDNCEKMFFNESTFRKYSFTPDYLQLMKDKDKEINGEIASAASSLDKEKIPEIKRTGTTVVKCNVNKVHTEVCWPKSVKSSPAGNSHKSTSELWKETLQDNKKKKSKKDDIPFIKYPVHKIPYPRTSWLTKEEQSLYLELYKKFSHHGISTITKETATIFKELQSKVSAEQEEYMQYLRDVSTRCYKEYFFINPEIDKYVNTVIENRIKCVKTYPRFYVQHDSVPVIGPPKNVIFFHIKTLLNLGTVPKLYKPKERLFANTKGFGSINKTIPPDYPEQASKKVCSEDCIASDLAVKHNVNIVISSSALCCLVDNHPPYHRQWEIPLVVREYEEKQGDGSIQKKRIVFIDKPFVSRNMTVRQKSEWGHKFTAKHKLQNNSMQAKFLKQIEKNGNTITLKRPKSNKGPNIESDYDESDNVSDDVPFDKVDIDDLETFGTGPSKKISGMSVSGNSGIQRQKNDTFADQSGKDNKNNDTRKETEIKEEGINIVPNDKIVVKEDMFIIPGSEKIQEKDYDSVPKLGLVSNDNLNLVLDPLEQNVDSGTASNQNVQEKHLNITSNLDNQKAKDKSNYECENSNVLQNITMKQQSVDMTEKTSSDEESDELQIDSDVIDSDTNDKEIPQLDGPKDRRKAPRGRRTTNTRSMDCKSIKNDLPTEENELELKGVTHRKVNDTVNIDLSKIVTDLKCGRRRSSKLSTDGTVSSAAGSAETSDNEQSCSLITKRLMSKLNDNEASSKEGAATGKSACQRKLRSASMTKTAVEEQDENSMEKTVKQTNIITVKQKKAALEKGKLMNNKEVNDNQIIKMEENAEVDTATSSIGSQVVRLCRSTRRTRSMGDVQITDVNKNLETECKKFKLDVSIDNIIDKVEKTSGRKRGRPPKAAKQNVVDNDENKGEDNTQICKSYDADELVMEEVDETPCKIEQNESDKDITESVDVDIKNIEEDLDLSESDSDVSVHSPSKKTKGLHFSDEEDSEEEKLKKAKEAQKSWISSVRKCSEVHTMPKRLKGQVSAEPKGGTSVEIVESDVKKPAVKVKPGLRKVIDDFDNMPLNKPPRKNLPVTRRRSQRREPQPTDTSNEIAETVSLASVIPDTSSKYLDIPQQSSSDVSNQKLHHDQLPSIPVPRRLVSVESINETNNHVPYGTKELIKSKINFSPQTVITEAPLSPEATTFMENPMSPGRDHTLDIAEPLEMDFSGDYQISEPKVIPLERDINSSGGIKDTTGYTTDNNMQSDDSNSALHICKLPGITPLKKNVNCGISDAERDILAPPKRLSSFQRDSSVEVKALTDKSIESVVGKQSNNISICQSKGKGKKLRNSKKDEECIGILDQLLPPELHKSTLNTTKSSDKNQFSNKDSAMPPKDHVGISHQLLPSELMRPPAQDIKTSSKFDNTSDIRDTTAKSIADISREVLTQSHEIPGKSKSDATSCVINNISGPQIPVERHNNIAGLVPGHRETTGVKEAVQQHLYQAPLHIRDPKEWEMYENPEDYAPPKQHNTTYNVWQLGEYKILIRCGLHCAKIPKKSKSKIEFIHLQPKLEYQSNHGYEQDTVSEVSRAWISLAIRNNCKLHKLRILSHNSEVIQTEEVTLEQLAQPVYTFSPQASLSALDGIFQKLHSLHPGHYLLGHSPGNTQAHIKKTSRSKVGVYDLHLAYNELHTDTTTIPWIPVDTNKHSHIHKYYHRIPCTFEPKDSEEAKKFQQNQTQFKGKKRNKKKKK